MIDRVHRELTDADLDKITSTYHAWREDGTIGVTSVKAAERGPYADIPGFCKSATLDDIRKHGHILTPGRYVGAQAQEDDGEAFDKKMKRLTTTLREQMQEGRKLDAAIEANLKELGCHGD